MKSPQQLARDAGRRNGAEYSRLPRPGSECYFMERDKTARTYSVFRVRIRPDCNAEIGLVLDGALYQAARECVLKHTVEENAKSVEREYGDSGEAS